MRNAGFISVRTHDRNEDETILNNIWVTQLHNYFYYKNDTKLALFYTFCKPAEDPLGQNMQQFHKTKVIVFVIKRVVPDYIAYILLIYEVQYVSCHQNYSCRSFMFYKI